MLDLLQSSIMQRALVAALLVGLAAPAVGTFIVQRRLALLGDGIGHVALTGVALGFLTGTAPVLTAVVVAVIGAVAIELVRGRGRTGHSPGSAPRSAPSGPSRRAASSTSSSARPGSTARTTAA